MWSLQLLPTSRLQCRLFPYIAVRQVQANGHSLQGGMGFSTNQAILLSAPVSFKAPELDRDEVIARGCAADTTSLTTTQSFLQS